jgi:hypothetical protein
MTTPYGGPSHPQPYPHPHPYPYPPQPQPPQVQVPAVAGDGWLTMAALTDGLLALGAALGVAAGVASGEDGAGGALRFSLTFLACVFVVSFVNHVIGTLLFRASLAKLLWGVRVVRWKDGRRPRFWQTVGRWLIGFVMIAAQYVLEGETFGQACGLRTVRRRDLRPAAPAAPAATG